MRPLLHTSPEYLNEIQVIPQSVSNVCLVQRIQEVRTKIKGIKTPHGLWNWLRSNVQIRS